MDAEWEAPIWRVRFQAYTPFELVGFIVGHEPDVAKKIAGEVLDEKLTALGAVPRQPR